MVGELTGKGPKKVQLCMASLLPWVLPHPCLPKGQCMPPDLNLCAGGLLELVGHSAKEKYVYFDMLP